MPCTTTVFVWLSKNAEFAEQYARAKTESADAFAEDMLDIADDSEDDITIDEDGVPRVNHENIQRARLRVDTRKWLASKLKPKKYGDKVAVGGAEDLPPVQVAGINITLVKPGVG